MDATGTGPGIIAEAGARCERIGKGGRSIRHSAATDIFGLGSVGHAVDQESVRAEQPDGAAGGREAELNGVTPGAAGIAEEHGPAFIIHSGRDGDGEAHSVHLDGAAGKHDRSVIIITV